MVYEPTVHDAYIEEPRALGVCCRVTSAIKIVAIVEILCLSLQMIGCFRAVTYGYHFYTMCAAAACLIGLLCTFCLFTAASKTDPGATLPYVIWKFINLALMVPGIGLLVYLWSEEDMKKYYISYNILTGALLLSVTYFVLSTFFLMAVVQGRKYLLLVAEKRARTYFIAQATAVPLAFQPGEVPPPYMSWVTNPEEKC